MEKEGRRRDNEGQLVLCAGAACAQTDASNKRQDASNKRQDTSNKRQEERHVCLGQPLPLLKFEQIDPKRRRNTKNVCLGQPLKHGHAVEQEAPQHLFRQRLPHDARLSSV